MISGEVMAQYRERKFVEALSEYEQLGTDQRLEVIINDNGLFITLEGITVTYSIPLFQNEAHEYLEEQVDKHERYLRRLNGLLLESKQNENRYRPSLLSSLFFKKISGKDDLDQMIKNAEKDAAMARLLKETAKEGKYFFERILVPGDEGLLQEYYGETLRRYFSLEKIEEYHFRLIGLAGRIEQTCASLLVSEMQKVSRLKEQQRLHFPEPE